MGYVDCRCVGIKVIRMLGWKNCGGPKAQGYVKDEQTLWFKIVSRSQENIEFNYVNHLNLRSSNSGNHLSII